jgi:hypothetical protein
MPDGRPYSDGVKAEAIALAVKLGNVSEAARTLTSKYPERAPTAQVITYWMQELEPGAFQRLSQKQSELPQARWSQIELAALDKLEEGIESGEVKGQVLAVTAGIGADKRLKAQEIARPTLTVNLLAMIDRRAQELMTDRDGRTIEATES